MNIKKYNNPTKLRFLMMIVVEYIKGQTPGDKVLINTEFDTSVKTDNYSSYSTIEEDVWCYIPQNANSNKAGMIFPWIHAMICNAKLTLLGVHYVIFMKFSQNYLYKFCYKANKRIFGEYLFDLLLIACATANYRNVVYHYL